MDFFRNVSTADKFRVALSNRYKFLQELHNDNEGVDINSHWKDIKGAVNYACKEVVGQRMPGQKEWISVET